MSVVVERGLARCPRCVAIADYTFVESGPNCLRYEVRCGRCGEAYREVHTPVAPQFSTAVEALAFRPPTPRAVPGGGVRRRAGAALAGGRERAATAVRRFGSWITVRTNVLRR